MKTSKGVAPGFLLLPARDYSWEIKNKIEITVPLSGRIDSMVKAVNTDQDVAIGGDDEFVIFEDNFLYIWEITRVLFAQAKYPKLENDEAFLIVAMKIQENDLVIYGQILKASGE